MLTLTALEPRATPAPLAVAASGGAVYERVGSAWEHRAAPFEAGIPVHVAADAAGVYVGAGERGAPRVVRYDRGWHMTESVFVGDPESRAGVDLSAFDRPTAGLKSADPRVQSYLDRIPPLAVDLSGVSVTVYPAGTVFAGVPGVPAAALGYYQPADETIHLRADHAPLVLHEVGHAVADALGVLRAQQQDGTSEEYAWAFARWANGESNPAFDALLAAA